MTAPRHAGHAGAREGGHYRVTLVAEAFHGRSALERHRLVYAALEPPLMNGSARPQHQRPHPGGEGG